MANPVLTATTNKGSYLPGEGITGTWVSTDADNSTETLRLEGEDSQGNDVSVDLVINRIDTFTMTKISWVRTGAELTFNNTARTFAGSVPTA